MLVFYNLPLSRASFLIFSLVFTIVSVAQQPRLKEKKVAKNLETHITYLASDELQGRQAASDGETISAAYIESQFQKTGLEPAGNYGYYHNISIPTLRMAQPNSNLVLDGKVQKLFTDYYPLSESSNNGILEGQAINVGYGIEDPGLNLANYTGTDVKGKIVLINIGLPGTEEERGRYQSWAGSEYRVDYAKTRGAKAVIFYSTNSTFFPSGTLNKTIENSGIPVLFVKKDLRKSTTVNVEIRVDILLLTTEAHNVLGYIDNGAPTYVIISANHDYKGVGDENVVYNGAGDNASGVAAMLELAKKIKAKPKHFKNNNYLFIAFTGTEKDLLGSKLLASKVLKPDATLNYFINLDKLGHLDSTKTLQVYGTGTSDVWTQYLEKTKYSKRKISTIASTGSLEQNTDAYSFYRNGIPSLLFSTGDFETEGTAADIASGVNYSGETFVVSYIYRFLCNIDTFSTTEKLTTKDTEEGLSPIRTLKYTEPLDNLEE